MLLQKSENKILKYVLILKLKINKYKLEWKWYDNAKMFKNEFYKTVVYLKILEIKESLFK